MYALQNCVLLRTALSPPFQSGSNIPAFSRLWWAIHCFALIPINLMANFLGILVQKLVYGSPPPTTVLEEEGIEQALALDAD
jgi:hypothetical protein